MNDELPYDNGRDTSKPKSGTTKQEQQPHLPECKAVPSLYAVLTREIECQGLIEEAYARQEQAIAQAHARAPELAGGDMTHAHQRAEKSRRRIEEDTRVEIEAIAQESNRNCKRFHKQRGAHNEKAHEYVVGLITGTLAPDAQQGEVPAC